MKLEMAIAPTRLLAMCLGPDGGGGFDIREVPRHNPGPDEVEIAVEAASVNPIEVRRAAG
jgi:reticulon-4-interacting protein 1, mitochondrial